VISFFSTGYDDWDFETGWADSDCFDTYTHAIVWNISVLGFFGLLRFYGLLGLLVCEIWALDFGYRA